MAGVLWDRDDVEGLREIFALIDADPSRRHTYVYARGGPQRARAGIAPTTSGLDATRIMIVRELAFASQRDRALQVLGTITEANLPRSTDPIDYIGALAAIGQLDRARRLIEDDQLGYRVKLAGAWLETALRERARRRDRFGHPTVHHSMTRASTCTRPIGVEPSSTT